MLESAGKVTVVAMLDKRPSAGGVEVTLEADNWSSASSAGDYGLPALFAIEQGATPGRADVTIVDDKVDEDLKLIDAPHARPALLVIHEIHYPPDTATDARPLHHRLGHDQHGLSP